MLRKPANFFIAIALLHLQSCAPPRSVVSIAFVATIDGEPVDCRTADNDVRMTDLRMYLAEPRLRNRDGNYVAVALLQDDHWQSRQVAFIDLEDGGRQCQNGSEDTNAVLRGTVPAGEYQGLKFILGVPFELNHQDPLRALAPLDDSAMHWHWRSGYKFLRAGLQVNGSNYFVHLGSAACNGSVQNIISCDRPNRVEVNLPNYRPGDSLQLDLMHLFESLVSGKSTASSCSSGPAESSCGFVFEKLGLDFATGLPSGDQQVIKVFRP